MSTTTIKTMQSTNQPEQPIWPALKIASSVSDLANIVLIISLVLGVVSTALIVWMGGVKEEHWDRSRQDSERTIAELNKETARLGAVAANAQTRIAELGKEAARLSADAEASRAEIAKANARAAEAQLALEQFKAPRQIAMENIPAFEEKIATFAGMQVDVMVLGEGPEPFSLGNQIGNALFSERAGWKGRVFGWTGGGSATGVAITLAPDADARAKQAAAALAAALNSAGVGAAIAPWPGDWKQFGGFTAGAVNPEAHIRVVIGTKPT